MWTLVKRDRITMNGLDSLDLSVGVGILSPEQKEAGVQLARNIGEWLVSKQPLRLGWRLIKK